jgi:pimeloyl-ACP methyl ester carboxylesterase
VERLVLYGGFARGGTKRGTEAERRRAEAMRVMIREGLGLDNPAFQQLFTTSFVPGGTKEQMDWFNELQCASVSPENAVRIRNVTDRIEVSNLLPRVTFSTLVHLCREDGIVPIGEGRRMAAMIPGARSVLLDGRNQLNLEDEPAWSRFLAEVRSFLA